MENKYRVEIDDELGYVCVNGKRWTIGDAADIFRVRMLNMMQSMEKKSMVSKVIEVIVREVTP